jgi:hypothetical protein
MNTIEHKTVSISRFSEDIIQYVLKDKSVIELEDSKKMYEATLEMAAGKKYAALIDARAETILTSEAREWSADPALHNNLIAQAIIVTSLANRIVGNFIIKFHKPVAPTRLFSTREKAIEWLNEKVSDFKIQKKVKYTSLVS